MNALFVLSQENLTLAKAECLAQTQGILLFEKENYLLIDTKKLPTTLAFTKKIYTILFWKTGQKKLEEELSHSQPIKGTVSIRRDQQVQKSPYISAQLRGKLLTYLERPDINLSTPDHNVWFIELPEENYFLGELFWENTEAFSKRRNHLLPAPHPTGMQPKLARGMINLGLEKHEVLIDPFCGSGGLLIEAGLLELDFWGGDISEEMIQRAEKNLSEFSLPHHLHHIDATKITTNDLPLDKEKRLIVSDLPYGKNSKADDLHTLYTTFFEHAHTLAHTMIIALPQIVNGEKILKETKWELQQHFTWKLHNTLEKHVYVVYSSKNF